MTKVYLLTDFENSPGKIYGIFSTESKAHEQAHRIEEDDETILTDIEEFTLDELLYE